MQRYGKDRVYIVAEIGQNHNGEFELAKRLVEEAAIAGCSAVKLNKRDISSELSKEAYDRVYDSPNAFARTYGKHREALELGFDEHIYLKKYANNRNMDYLLSICDIPSLEFAISLKPPLIKIPSKEINNIPLLERVVEYNLPIALSMGLCTYDEYSKALKILKTDPLALNIIRVVATSQYPCDYDNVNLSRLTEYGTGILKGFSSHTPDPMLGIAAVAMGATYIEYHITLNREMQGSDHSCSLIAEEFAYMIDCIDNLLIAYGDKEIPQELPYHLIPTAKKLRKHKCEDGVYRI